MEIVCVSKIISKHKTLTPRLIKSGPLWVGGAGISIFNLPCDFNVQPRLRTTVLERDHFKVSVSHLGLLLERIP